jgi:predicted type IV restriction endonuclease
MPNSIMDLISFIENQKNKNFDYLKERQVEKSIIDPMLKLLGWDTSRVDEVCAESCVGRGSADIALKIENYCRVILEIKRGGSSLSNFDYERQLLSYAEGVNSGEPADLAILTNGTKWQFYLPSIGGGYNQKRFYSVDISKEDPRDVASVFVAFLSRDSISSGMAVTYAMSVIGMPKKKDRPENNEAEMSTIDESGKYKEYARAISPHLMFIKEQIGKSPNGTIRIRIGDMSRSLGMDFINKNPTSIYWGLKYILFQKGIIICTETQESGEKMFVMRYACSGDKLPPSLAKCLRNKNQYVKKDDLIEMRKDHHAVGYSSYVRKEFDTENMKNIEIKKLIRKV